MGAGYLYLSVVVCDQCEEVALAEDSDGKAFRHELRSFPMFRAFFKSCNLIKEIEWILLQHFLEV